ncbi:MAG TPA: pilus assembly protein PilC [Nitrospiraceae bacterium]|nr:MAG: pilus assembly protein PilC [Nitrospirae bacterium GWA2_46_11]OGW23650.1 MAG: pilus assembly protein PilC [Nitrospirae bacterium GWB2_47_37]HAK89938.1 pilus assembly protein PilC [Nitrospiraceae bacterium]HCZ11778.1 pilus assembly protein PilC [Nitrospiraceae bacterium]
MPNFKWKGKTAKGEPKSGEMSAAGKDEVIAALRRQGILPSLVTETGAKKVKKQRVTDKDVVVFTRQFATMFIAGIPIVQGLDIMAKQSENKTLGAIIGQIKADVESGTTLADAMKKHPRVFDDLFINLVAAGEAGGVLDGVLLRLANYMEKSMKLKKKVKGAMIYPSIVVTVAVLVIAIIMVFVIPIFAKIFGEMGAQLPAPTRSVIWLSNFLSGIGGLMILGGGVGSFIGIKQYRRTEIGKKKTDAILLKLPIIGDLVRKVAVARFTRTLGTLLNSGVPILDGLEICARSSGNKVVEEVVFDVRKEVSAGKTLAEPLSKADVFPPMVTQMINVGESTGALDQMLVKIADFYDDEVDDSVGNLTTMLEPLLMVFLGTTVGYIVIALYLPIFKMGDTVK